MPDVAHLFYSSKKALRSSGVVSASMTLSDLRDGLPAHSQTIVDRCLGHDSRVLLYDNNVTTFTTLAHTKALLRQLGARDVRAVVANVYYDNIARALLGQQCEPLCESWIEVLDYAPVANYVTAFSTWGTSEKNRFLHLIFGEATAATLRDQIDEPVVHNGIFKVCRVHNLFDLRAVLEAGATAIGVHAVSPASAEYAVSENRYAPRLAVSNVDARLPVARFEVDAIQAMQRHIPAHVHQVLVIERPLTLPELQSTFDAYGINPKRASVQLQYRITGREIDAIKTITPRVIAAIGAAQHDFTDYFLRLQNGLDPETDLVLMDASTHQPDFIVSGQVMTDEAPRLIRTIAPAMTGNAVPILLADDTDPDTMQRCLDELLAAKVAVAGIDMQNSTEVKKSDQRYRLAQDGGRTYQALVRKSPDLLHGWGSVLCRNSWQTNQLTIN